jgi:superfamily I DNA and/or RNA helicase
MVAARLVRDVGAFGEVCSRVSSLKPTDAFWDVFDDLTSALPDGAVARWETDRDAYIDAAERLACAEARVKTKMAAVAQVGLATITSCWRLRIEPDVLVFDEAGTVCTEELLRFASKRLKCIVVFGDENQIGPYSPYGTEPRSLMADAAVAKVCLERQYRIPRSVATVLNELVYAGKYVGGTDRGGVTFVDTPAGDDGYMNREQVRRVMRDVRGWVARHPNETAIIVTPYNAQLRVFRDALEGLDVRASTITGAQGYEAHTVFLSLVKSWPTPFLDYRSINVAITRATVDTFVYTHVSTTRRWAHHARQRDSLTAKIFRRLMK